MTDTHTKRQRSQNMSAIRSTGNKTTEVVLVDLFRRNNMRGWRRHFKKLPGRPDFYFKKYTLALFIDGCFWHGCRKCGLRAKSNKKYWAPKTARNVTRDKEVNKKLKNLGFRVLRIWEHEIKLNPEKVIAKIKKALRPHPGGD